MKKPFEVIVMQDVREPEEQIPLPNKLSDDTIVTGSDIERQMQKEGEEPTRDEVHESINALRPDTTLLDEAQYNKLSKKLTNGFTTEQLRDFFAHSVNLSAVEGDTVHFLRKEPTKLESQYNTTQWRPGRTPLETRLPLGPVVKKSEKLNKSKTAEQILRLSWSLSIHTEEQKVGEMEMQLRDWELKFLFDLPGSQSPGRSMYEDFIDSAFLLRACKVALYRPHEYLRISGRRQDAEEVARRIESRLSEVGSSGFGLNAYQPLLGTPGWASSLDYLFSEDDIKMVQRRTSTIIEKPKSARVQVHGLTESNRHEAHRILLNLLELRTPGRLHVLEDVTSQQNDSVSFPEHADSTLHLRHRKLKLTRMAVPARKRDFNDVAAHRPPEENVARPQMSSIRERVVNELAETKAMEIPSVNEDPASYWDTAALQVSPWQAQICKVLHADPAFRRSRKKKRTDSSAMTVVNAQIPRLEGLLTFFEPTRQVPATSKPSPLLIARFIPQESVRSGPLRSDKRNIETLPTIELAYRLYKTEEGKDSVWLVNAWAILERQDIRVPLPTESTDLRLERSVHLRMAGMKFRSAPEIRRFTDALRESLQASEKGNLVGQPSLQFSLPAALARGPSRSNTKAGRREVPIEYSFIGFEQQQTTEFGPVAAERLPAKMNEEMKKVLEGLGKDVHLQLKEVAAGSVGGRRLETIVHYRPPKPPWQLKQMPALEDEVPVEQDAEQDGPESFKPFTFAREQKSDAEPSPSEQELTSRVVHSAMGLTRLLTKLNALEMQPMRHHWRESRASEEAQPKARQDEAEARDAKEAAEDAFA